MISTIGTPSISQPRSSKNTTLEQQAHMPKGLATNGENPILKIDDFTIEFQGVDTDPMFRKGTNVNLSPSLQRIYLREIEQRRSQLADSCNYIYESPNPVQFKRPETSILPYFGVTTEAGMASSVMFTIDIENDYRLPYLFCCGTDTPLLTDDDFERCHLYSGFANMVLSTDICLWDRMQCSAANNPNQLDIEDLMVMRINEAFDKAAEHVILHGLPEKKIFGIKNHPYIPTFVMPQFSEVNPVISFRRMAQILDNRQNVVFDSTRVKPDYVLFLPTLVTDLLNSQVTTGGTGCSGVLTTLLGLLTGDSTTIDAGVPVTRFRVIGLRELNYAWDTGSSLHHLGFIMPNMSVIRDTVKLHRPFRLIDLGQEQRGVRVYHHYGSRIGSIEFSGANINYVARIVIPRF